MGTLASALARTLVGVGEMCAGTGGILGLAGLLM